MGPTIQPGRGRHPHGQPQLLVRTEQLNQSNLFEVEADRIIRAIGRHGERPGLRQLGQNLLGVAGLALVKVRLDVDHFTLDGVEGLV